MTGECTGECILTEAEASVGSGDVLSVYRERLIATAWRITNDRSLAEDIVSEVFLGFLESGGEMFKGASTLSTYLYRIVINRCIDARRRLNLFNRISEQIGWEQYPHPKDTYEIKDLVRRLLVSIPPLYRVPFILAEVDEMSYAQIAEIQNVPLNTIRTRIFRCREMMRKKLERMGYP